MKILSGGDIAKEVKGINPQFIAVGYIGKDWHRYIDIDFVKEIIVSPTIGSNPLAIKEIINEIGFENVYFLDNLHAKLYIGADRYAFGSFNLSVSAFEAERGLTEFGCITNQNLEQVKAFFESCKSEANKRYETKEAKEKALAILFEKYKNRNVENFDLLVNLAKEESIEKNLTVSDDFYIIGVRDEAHYDEELVKQNNERYENVNIKDIEHCLKEVVTVNRLNYADKIRLNSWVLQVNFDFRETDVERYHWMFVNSIAHNVNEDGDSMLICDNLSPTPKLPPIKVKDAMPNRERITKILNMDKYKPLFFDIMEDESISELYDFEIATQLSKEFKKEYYKYIKNEKKS